MLTGNRDRLKPLALFVAVVAAYANSLWGDFQFSDYNVIVNNPAVHSWQGWLETARQMGIRPLLKFSYTLSWTAGLGALGFHLFNVAVHALATLLVYLLSGRFVEGALAGRGREWGGRAAFLAAMLFALHPVHTEAVTYICGRSSSLSALFYLGSVWAYLEGVERGKRRLRLAVSPLLFLAAVATKETAVTLPLALLLWEILAGRGWRRALSEQWAHWGLLVVAMAAILTHPKYLSLLLFSSELRNMQDNLINQVNGLGYLLSRLVLVHRLNIDPDLAIVSRMDAAMWLKLALSLAALGWGWGVRRSRPWLLFGMLWFLLALMPSNSIFARLDLVNERHLYLADFGVFLALSCEAALWHERLSAWRPWLTAGGAAACGILFLFTVLRNADYRSEVALWESAARNSPQKARCFNNLGCAYELAQRPGDAARAYRKALRLDPWHENAAANLERLGEAAGYREPARLAGPSR